MDVLCVRFRMYAAQRERWPPPDRPKTMVVCVRALQCKHGPDGATPMSMSTDCGCHFNQMHPKPTYIRPRIQTLDPRQPCGGAHSPPQSGPAPRLLATNNPKRDRCSASIQVKSRDDAHAPLGLRSRIELRRSTSTRPSAILTIDRRT